MKVVKRHCIAYNIVSLLRDELVDCDQKCVIIIAVECSVNTNITLGFTLCRIFIVWTHFTRYFAGASLPATTTTFKYYYYYYYYYYTSSLKFLKCFNHRHYSMYISTTLTHGIALYYHRLANALIRTYGHLSTPLLTTAVVVETRTHYGMQSYFQSSTNICVVKSDLNAISRRC
jgi:hypothetical protein